MFRTGLGGSGQVMPSQEVPGLVIRGMEKLRKVGKVNNVQVRTIHVNFKLVGEVSLKSQTG